MKLGGSFLIISLFLMLSCSKNKAGEVRVVNASDSTVVMRHEDVTNYQTKTLAPNTILERLANGQYCTEYYKDYTFLVKNGDIISKDWRHALNWVEYTENPGTKEECTICEFRIENKDL